MNIGICHMTRSSFCLGSHLAISNHALIPTDKKLASKYN